MLLLSFHKERKKCSLSYLKRQSAPDFLNNAVDDNGSNLYSKASGKAGTIFWWKADNNKAPKIPDGELETIDENTFYFKTAENLIPNKLLKNAKNPMGSLIKFPDGNEWLVPQIRIAEGDKSDIPLRQGRKNNQLLLTPYKEHEEIQKLAAELAAHVLDGKAINFPAWNWIETILQVNYHITQYHAMAFSLYEEKNFFNKIVGHMLNVPFLEAYHLSDEITKKN